MAVRVYLPKQPLWSELDTLIFLADCRRFIQNTLKTKVISSQRISGHIVDYVYELEKLDQVIALVSAVFHQLINAPNALTVVSSPQKFNEMDYTNHRIEWCNTNIINGYYEATIEIDENLENNKILKTFYFFTGFDDPSDAVLYKLRWM